MNYSTNVAVAQRYLQALEALTLGPALAEFFTNDMVQVELPNRLGPAGAQRDLAAILEAGQRSTPNPP